MPTKISAQIQNIADCIRLIEGKSQYDGDRYIVSNWHGIQVLSTYNWDAREELPHTIVSRLLENYHVSADWLFRRELPMFSPRHNKTANVVLINLKKFPRIKKFCQVDRYTTVETIVQNKPITIMAYNDDVIIPKEHCNDSDYVGFLKYLWKNATDKKPLKDIYTFYDWHHNCFKIIEAGQSLTCLMKPWNEEFPRIPYFILDEIDLTSPIIIPQPNIVADEQNVA